MIAIFKSFLLIQKLKIDHPFLPPGYPEKKTLHIQHTPKEQWKALKMLGLPSKKVLQQQIFVKENAIRFEVKENANFFQKFYSSLAGNLLTFSQQL